MPFLDLDEDCVERLSILYFESLCLKTHQKFKLFKQDLDFKLCLKFHRKLFEQSINVGCSYQQEKIMFNTLQDFLRMV